MSWSVFVGWKGLVVEMVEKCLKKEGWVERVWAADARERTVNHFLNLGG